jgi:hypothetical protein
VHYANLYLGRVALKQGNIQEAGSFLLLAGKTPGSPQLDDYGPDMTLADELLQRGQSEVVLQYFRECEHFWRGSSKYKLDQWTKDVQGGARPDFGVRSGLQPLSPSHRAAPN